MIIIRPPPKPQQFPLEPRDHTASGGLWIAKPFRAGLPNSFSPTHCQTTFPYGSCIGFCLGLWPQASRVAPSPFSCLNDSALYSSIRDHRDSHPPSAGLAQMIKGLVYGLWHSCLDWQGNGVPGHGRGQTVGPSCGLCFCPTSPSSPT